MTWKTMKREDANPMRTVMHETKGEAQTEPQKNTTKKGTER